MAESADSRVIMTIDLKKNRLRVHKAALKAIGIPPYVQILLSVKSGAIVILGRGSKTPGGQEIPVVFDKPDSSGTFDIYSKELLTRIRNEFIWPDDGTLYHLRGYDVPEEGGVCFPLSTLQRAEVSDVQDPE